MSWGSWILLLVYPILIINTLLRVPDKIREKLPWLKIISEKINNYEYSNKIIGSLSMIIGGVLGMYTESYLALLEQDLPGIALYYGYYFLHQDYHLLLHLFIFWLRTEMKAECWQKQIMVF